MNAQHVLLKEGQPRAVEPQAGGAPARRRDSGAVLVRDTVELRNSSSPRLIPSGHPGSALRHS